MTPQSPFARLLITLSLFINARPKCALRSIDAPIPLIHRRVRVRRCERARREKPFFRTFSRARHPRRHLAHRERVVMMMMTQQLACRAHRAHRARPRRSTTRRASNADDIQWETKTNEFASERVLESCLGAMASGDADALEACLLEADAALESAETSMKTIEALRARPEVSGDAFWTQKLKELSAERVFEDCMTAVMRGDADEIEACVLDAENDELLRE